MEYLSSKDAAAAWGISERRVVELLDLGRVDGTFKHGRDWLIPRGAKKPSDRRSVKQQEQCFPYWLFIDSLSFAPGDADKTARNLRGEERLHAEAMFAGLRGSFEGAVELYRTTPKNGRL